MFLTRSQEIRTFKVLYKKINVQNEQKEELNATKPVVKLMMESDYFGKCEEQPGSSQLPTAHPQTTKLSHAW